MMIMLYNTIGVFSYLLQTIVVLDIMMYFYDIIKFSLFIWFISWNIQNYAAVPSGARLKAEIQRGGSERLRVFESKLSDRG